MGRPILPTFFLQINGTSLSNSRLCTPPFSWPIRLLGDMRAAVECQGPVQIMNIAKGSQTSVYGAMVAGLYANERPTHVLYEDFGINDCAIGPISLPDAAANNQSMIDSWLAANPDVIMMHQTMSPASAGDTNRTNLSAYYTQGTQVAANNGIPTLDHYATWPKPLDPAFTVNNDGLHPVWDAYFEIYAYPSILLWARQMMANFWGVAGPLSLLTQGGDPLVTQGGIILEVED